MKCRAFAAILCIVVAMECHGQPSLPSNFQGKTIHSPAGADIFVRWGGTGPVVLLIHGYAENSDSWAPLAEDLMRDHTVVVPDLRGIGRSSKPEGGYDKKTQAVDMRAVVTTLGYDKTFVVAHDIGNMVAYAYAATYPTKVERLVVWTHPSRESNPGARYCKIPECGTSTFTDQTQSAWWRDASASISIAYGTTSRVIPGSWTKQPEISSQQHTPSLEVCGLDSRNLLSSPKTQRITRSLSRRS